jgi:hypothetical protein
VQPCKLLKFTELPFTKKKRVGLVEWLKVKALSSSPSTAKEKKKSQSEENAELRSKPR